MSAVDLLQPILDGGLQRNNFFNGRLLSAEDLRAEQDANRAQHRHLANAVGDGVSWGLSVTLSRVGPESPRVSVRRGVALNRVGDILYLPDDSEVTLVPDKSAVESAEGLFAQCEPPRPTASLSPEGAYVLVIAPASGYRGTALVSDPNTTSAGRGSCGARFSVEGVRFRLVPLALNDLEGISTSLRSRITSFLPPGTNPANREKLRNLLAHLCYGTHALREYFTDPLKKTTSGKLQWLGWGALDAMRARGDLTDCDVPLSIIVITTAGISYVDVWSVRRKLIDQEAIDTWHAAAGQRRISEAEATFLQFQSQLDIVKTLATPSSTAASTYFDLLPGGGWLPIGTGGFNWTTFLGPHAPPSVTPVDAALLRGIVERSWFDEPFSLDTNPPVPLHVFQVPGESFVVFARSHKGNVRVFLSPAPTSSESVDVIATSKTGMVTHAPSRSAGTVIIPDLAPGRQSVAVTAPDYAPVTPRDADVVGGRTVDLNITLAPLPNGTISVKAIDKATGENLGERVTLITATGGGKTLSGVFQPNGRNWLISDVPAGTYSLSGVATGYKVATLSGVGPITRGNQTTANLIFEREVRKPEPSKCVSTELRRPPVGKVRLCLVLSGTEFDESYFYGVRTGSGIISGDRSKVRIEKRSTNRSKSESKATSRYVAETGELIYRIAPWLHMEPMQPVTPEVTKWLGEWREWFADQFNDERIRKSTPVVYFDPNYHPPTNAASVPRSPPGYAVFVDFGVPVSIQLEGGVSTGKVRIEDAGLVGISTFDINAMCELAGVCYINDLRWSWEELLGDTLGDPIDTTKFLIHEAADAITRINDDRSYYAGVDKALNDAMKQHGYGTDVAVANADPLQMATDLNISEGFANRLVQQARKLVSLESWSLESMGFTEQQLDDFNAHGINSKGTFVAHAGFDAGKAEIANVLGFANQPTADRDTAISNIANEAISGIVLGSVAIAPEVSVYSLAGVNAVTGSMLVKANLGTAEAISGETPEAVSAAANISLDSAKKLVAEAQKKSKSGMSVGSVAALSKDEQVSLDAMFGGKATVKNVAGKSAAELAGVFGGDIGKAGAFVQGLKGALGMGMG